MTTTDQISKELEAFYKSYLSAGSSEDFATIAESFACPCALITGERGLDQLATAAEVRRMMGKFLDDLKERGWTRSEINQLKTWPLAEDLAMLLVDLTRYKADGSILESLRACYMVRRDANSWKIITTSEVKPPFLGPGDLPR